MTISRFSSPRALTACAAAAFLAWSAAAALAQCTEDHLITASSPAADDQFGAGVAVEGEWLAIGSWGRDGAAGADAGAVSVFRRNPLTRDWDAVQTLTASDGGTGDHFGSAVSLDSGWLAIGAPDQDHNGVTDCGAVYVFQNVNGSWIEKGELLASDGAAGDQYGASLCVKGNTLVVGAWLDDGLAGNDTGSAYAYSYHTIFGWANEQKLTAADAAYEDKFGVSVACDDSLLVCGAYHDDDPGVGFDAGSVYVFCRSGGLWSACQKLIAGDRGINDELGASVAILGDVIAAGAPGNDETFPAVDVGAVYVFRRHGGSFFEEEKLMPGAISPFDRFGAAVGVGDDVVVGAAPGDDHPDRDMGSAFTFRHVGGFGSACGWVEDRWLRRSSPRRTTVSAAASPSTAERPPSASVTTMPMGSRTPDRLPSSWSPSSASRPAPAASRPVRHSRSRCAAAIRASRRCWRSSRRCSRLSWWGCSAPIATGSCRRRCPRGSKGSPPRSRRSRSSSVRTRRSHRTRTR